MKVNQMCGRVGRKWDLKFEKRDILLMQMALGSATGAVPCGRVWGT